MRIAVNTPDEQAKSRKYLRWLWDRWRAGENVSGDDFRDAWDEVAYRRNRGYLTPDEAHELAQEFKRWTKEHDVKGNPRRSVAKARIRSRKRRVTRRGLTDFEIARMLGSARPRTQLFGTATVANPYIVRNTPRERNTYLSEARWMAKQGASSPEWAEFQDDVHAANRRGHLTNAEAQDVLDAANAWRAGLHRSGVYPVYSPAPASYYAEPTSPEELERIRRDLLRPLPRRTTRKNPRRTSMHAATNRRRRRRALPRDPKTGRFLTARQRAARRVRSNPRGKSRARRGVPFMWGGRKSRMHTMSAKGRGPYGKTSRWRRAGLPRGTALRTVRLPSGRTSWRVVKVKKGSKAISPRLTLRRGALRRYGKKTRYSKRERKWNNKRSRAGRHLIAARSIRRGQRVDGLVRLNPRTGEIIMPRAYVANPRRRRRRARNPRVITVNRRRRRTRRARNPRYRMAGNPSMGSIVSRAKGAIMPALAGTAGGLAGGFIDTKLNGRVIAGLAKFGLAIVGAGFLRGRPTAASGFIGGVMGGMGYQLGVKLGGGLVAHNKGSLMGGLADMASDDPQLEATIAEAESIEDLVNAADAYEMGDLVDE
jgi:hypothetical protein